MSTNKQTHKITDDQFRETYLENHGSNAKTARAIEKKYGITYTRQSVQERALNFPDLRQRAIEMRLQHSEDALSDYADDDSLDKKSSIRIHTGIANRLSKFQLLYIKTEAAKSTQEPEPPEVCFEIDGKEITF